MIKTIKHLALIGIIVLICAGVYYAKLDRFDVVACLLILINAACILFMELKDIPQNKSDVEQMIETFDRGYVQGLHDFLEGRLKSIHDHEVIEVYINEVNRSEKMKNIGRFELQLLKQNYPGWPDAQINFIPRYTEEGEGSSFSKEWEPPTW